MKTLQTSHRSFKDNRIISIEEEFPQICRRMYTVYLESYSWQWKQRGFKVPHKVHMTPLGEL
jgi:hypothetical protein